jgi:hypothetical protein
MGRKKIKIERIVDERNRQVRERERESAYGRPPHASPPPRALIPAAAG